MKNKYIIMVVVAVVAIIAIILLRKKAVAATGAPAPDVHISFASETQRIIDEQRSVPKDTVKRGLALDPNKINLY